MVNKNTYNVKMMQSILLEITKPDQTFKTYAMMKDQLVSILYIDPNDGKAKILRGRIEEFILENTRNSFDISCSSTQPRGFGKPSIQRVKIDTSKQFETSFVVIDLTSILEVNPVDWKYQDLKQVEIDLDSEDWNEKNGKAEAPTALYSYRNNIK